MRVAADILNAARRTCGDGAFIEGPWRYALWRDLTPRWTGSTNVAAVPQPPRLDELCFLCANPSTADGQTNDASLRRMLGFARRERAAWLWVVNLSSRRETHPVNVRALANHRGGYYDMHNDSFLDGSDEPRDWVGSDNDAFVEAAVARSALVVLAWGDCLGRLADERAVALDLYHARDKLYCLGRTKAGRPKHPLRLRVEQPLEAW